MNKWMHEVMDVNSTGLPNAPVIQSQQSESDDSNMVGQDQIGQGQSQPPRKPFRTNTETFNKAIEEVFVHLMEEETFNLITNCGRQLRNGDMEALGELEDSSDEYKVNDTYGYDIFGNPLTKKVHFECDCSHCGRTLASARFAPHLEKCLGMGRISSRIASLKNRKLVTSTNSAAVSSSSISRDVNMFSQNTNSNSSDGSNDSSPLKNCEDALSDDAHSDDEDDEEWTIEKKKKTKKTGEKITPKKKGPIGRLKHTIKSKRGGSPTVTNSPVPTISPPTADVGNYDELTNDSIPA